MRGGGTLAIGWLALALAACRAEGDAADSFPPAGRDVAPMRLEPSPLDRPRILDDARRGYER